ncbi:hypothetical protein B0J11DRAFT_39651 [Dendryphion nanum]|uniref:Uncharacterized protein n=1 Tax=Dendryphion nanum TaxID=256645 RepID=A0A9P9EGS8_9PLEO|nr:hypothetical protein B0J11DRAFT_39651 [Dendryphion nanum]
MMAMGGLRSRTAIMAWQGLIAPASWIKGNCSRLTHQICCWFAAVTRYWQLSSARRSLVPMAQVCSSSPQRHSPIQLRRLAGGSCSHCLMLSSSLAPEFSGSGHCLGGWEGIQRGRSAQCGAVRSECFDARKRIRCSCSTRWAQWAAQQCKADDAGWQHVPDAISTAMAVAKRLQTPGKKERGTEGERHYCQATEAAGVPCSDRARSSGCQTVTGQTVTIRNGSSSGRAGGGDGCSTGLSGAY